MMGPDEKQIGAWLRKARQRARIRARKEGRRDFSVEKAAQRVGVGEKTVRLWEKGANPPPADKFLALAVAYEVEATAIAALMEKRPARTVTVMDAPMAPHPSTRSAAVSEGKTKRPA